MQQAQDQKKPESSFFDDASREDSSENEPEYRIGDVIKRPDGSYQWAYAMDMKENRSILNLLLVIFGASFLVIIGIVMAATGFDYEVLRILLLCFGVLILIVFFSYWLTSRLFGGTYLMNYEMDEDGIIFEQVAEQAEKTRLIASLAALAGAAAQNVSSVSSALAARNSSNSYSSFQSVKRITGDRAHNLIKVASPFLLNMIYVDDAYYEFVFDYIACRCEKARIIPG